MVHFHCAIARLLFNFVAFNDLFRFDCYRVVPVSMENASFDVVRNALAMRMVMRRWARECICYVHSSLLLSILDLRMLTEVG